MGKIRKAATAVDAAADVYRAVGLVALEIVKDAAAILQGLKLEGKLKGRIAIGFDLRRRKLTIEGEVDLPKQKG